MVVLVLHILLCLCMSGMFIPCAEHTCIAMACTPCADKPGFAYKTIALQAEAWMANSSTQQPENSPVEPEKPAEGQLASTAPRSITPESAASDQDTQRFTGSANTGMAVGTAAADTQAVDATLEPRLTSQTGVREDVSTGVHGENLVGSITQELAAASDQGTQRLPSPANTGMADAMAIAVTAQPSGAAGRSTSESPALGDQADGEVVCLTQGVAAEADQTEELASVDDAVAQLPVSVSP